MKKLMKFFKDEDGATAVEYGLMLALIAIVIIGMVILVGRETCNTFNAVGSALGSANAS